MARPPKKKKRGRPQKEISWRIVGRLCQIQCTQEEIASVLGVSINTLDRACQREHKMNFGVFQTQKGLVGLKNIRRKQFDLALKGDRTMLVWLGKQYLKQKDTPLIEQNNTASTTTFNMDMDEKHSVTDLIAMLLDREPLKMHTGSTAALNPSQSVHVDDITDDITGMQEVE